MSWKSIIKQQGTDAEFQNAITGLFKAIDVFEESWDNAEKLRTTGKFDESVAIKHFQNQINLVKDLEKKCQGYIKAVQYRLEGGFAKVNREQS